MTPRTITWAAHHDVGGSYVIERDNADDTASVVYGPMLASQVTAFIADRRALFTEMLRRQLRSLST